MLKSEVFSGDAQLLLQALQKSTSKFQMQHLQGFNQWFKVFICILFVGTQDILMIIKISLQEFVVLIIFVL